MHEQSITIERDGQHFIESGVEPGKVLEGSFASADEANSRARARSKEVNLIPSFEKDLIPDVAYDDKQHSVDTVDYLSHVASAANASFSENELQPPELMRTFVSSEDREKQLRSSLSAKEALEQGGLFNQFLVEKVGQGASSAEIESYIQGKPLLLSPDKNVLERRAAKWLIDQGLKNPERATAVINDELGLADVDTSKTDMQQEHLALLMRLNTMMAKASDQWQKENIGKNAVDLLSVLLVPFQTTVSSAKIHGRKAELLSASISENISKFRGMPFHKQMQFLDEFEEASKSNSFFGQNTLTLISQIQELINHRGEDGALYNLIEGTDALPFIQGLYKGVKALKTISGAANMASASDLVVARTLDLKAKEAAGKAISVREADETIYNILPSSVSDFIKITPTGQKYNIVEKPVGLVNKAIQEAAIVEEWKKNLPTLMEEAKAAGLDVSSEKIDPINIYAILKDIVKVPLLTINEQEDAVVHAVKTLLKRFDIEADVSYIINQPRAYPLYDVAIDDLTTIPTVHMYLGHGTDKLKGFTSIGSAHAGAKRLGLEKGFYEVSDKSGQYFIKVSRDATGTSFIKIATDEQTPYVIGVVGKWLQGSTTILKESTLEAGRTSVLAASRLNKAVTASLDSVKNLKGASKDTYESLMLSVQQEGKWKSVSDVISWYETNYQRRPHVKELEAYLSTRHIHKVYDLVIRNTAIRIDLTGANFEEVLFKPQFNKEAVGLSGKNVDNIKIGKQVTTTSIDPSIAKIFDVEEGTFVPFMNRDLLKDRLTRNSSNVLIKLLTEDKQLGNYVIINKNDINIRPLREAVVSEIDGPHVVYDFGATGGLIKQQTIRFVNGIRTIMNPKTHFAVQSGAEGKQFAKDYNTALEAFKSLNKKSSAAERAKVNDVISTLTRFAGIDEMEAAIKSGKIERTPFEFVKSGELPSYKITEFRGDAIDPDFKNFSNTTQEAIDTGRLFYSERGERLLHPKEGKAKLLEPDKILKTAINNVTNTQAFNNYKIREITKWVKEYGPYLEIEKGRPDIEKFYYGKFNLSPNAEMKINSSFLAQAEGQRLAIQRMLNQQGSLQAETANWRNHIVDVIEGKWGYSAAKAAADVSSSNPSLFMRGVAYHAYLGMLDISQIAVQMAVLPGIMAVSPKHGLNSLIALPFIRMALLNPSHDEAVAKLLSKFTLGKGMNKDAFVSMIKDLRRSGFDIVDGNIAELDNLARSGNLHSWAFNKASKAIDAASIFFKEGEKANRLVGWSIAWSENFERTGKGLSTAEGFGTVSRRANVFASNMSKDGKAWWQEGWMSLPSQFMGHPARILELLLHPTSGFTKNEKLRFYAGLALAYGPVLGVGGGGWEFLKQKYFEATGEEPDITVMNGLRGGLLQMLLPDTEWSRLAPLGSGMPGLDFFDSDKGISYFSFLGPPGELGSRFIDSTLGNKKLQAIIFGEASIDIASGAEFVNDMLKNISSWNRWDKAITAYQTGKMYATNGMLKQKDLTTIDAAMLTVGFPPIGSRMAYEAQFFLKEINEKVFKDAAIASQFFIKALQSPVNSPEWKRNMGYFEYMRSMNVDGDLTGNNGRDFTRAVEQLIRKHEAYNTDVFLDYQRKLGRTRDDLKARR